MTNQKQNNTHPSPASKNTLTHPPKNKSKDKQAHTHSPIIDFLHYCTTGGRVVGPAEMERVGIYIER